MNGQFLTSLILIFAGLCLIGASAFILAKGRRRPGYAFLLAGFLLAIASIVLIMTLDTDRKSAAKPYNGPVGAVVRVIVDQADPLRNMNGQKLLHKEINDASVANELYKRLTELPEELKGFHSCPPDNGVTFTFQFEDAYGHPVHTATMRATGCRQVAIDHETALWMGDPKADATKAYLLQVLGLKADEFTGIRVPGTGG